MTDDDRSALEGIEGDDRRLEAEKQLIVQTDNTARTEDGQQPAEVEG
jgi:hypothetical protein